MTQVASWLVVATVFTWLNYGLQCLHLPSEGEGLLHETKLPMQELEPKMLGGWSLCARGGA